MQKNGMTRREFLKFSGLISAGAIASLAFRPFFGPEQEQKSASLVRVAIPSVSIYKMPDDKSQILYQRYRDEILNIYEEVESQYGPGYNPIWYRVWGGYVHSGYLQKVNIRYNSVLDKIPEKGQLAEITVPISDSFRNLKRLGWERLYRLYYGSVHWISGIEEGPDGEPWYSLLDELLEVEYSVPAIHVRPIGPEELIPISPDIPTHQKKVEVSLAKQELTAFENENIVLKTKISSGIQSHNLPADVIPTETPKGSFYVQSKMPSKHMGDGNLTSDLNAYGLPGVAWVSFFEPETGVAFHGTYWHTNYGIPMSHGCINMRPEEAKWLFRWLTPVTDTQTIEKIGLGTKVVVY